MAALTCFAALLFAVCTQGFVLPEHEQFAFLGNEKVGANNEDFATPEAQQQIPKKIAIIGSGITGAVAALRLYEGFRLRTPADEIPVITVLERNPIIGGRITQAYAYNNPLLPVDSCAATFSIRDSCIASSATSVGLLIQPLGLNQPQAGVAVWDGEKIVGLVEETGFRSPNLWSFFRKMRWYNRYGNTPWEFQNEVLRVRLEFDQLLPPSVIGNGQVPVVQTNLSQVLINAGLKGYEQDSLCAANEGVELKIPPGKKANRFYQEVAIAGEIERFFDDVTVLNVLELYLGFEEANLISIEGGNLRLIERLLKLSSLDVRVESEVQKIERVGTGLEVTVVPSNDVPPYIENFDAVVLTTSLELANLTIEPPLGDIPGLKQKYENSFITHFTTGSLLNASYFNLTRLEPQNILTTANDGDAGIVPAFYSLTLLRQIVHPEDPTKVENLYKLVSRDEVLFEEIVKYLKADSKEQPISWIDRQPLPRSVPVLDPSEGSCRSVLEQIEIAPGLYYAGGGEQVIASAEFGCRMGLNAANLVLAGGQR